MDSNSNSLAKRQSTLIKAMRFPLICLVVWAHSIAPNMKPMELSFDGWNVYHFVSELISCNLCKIAVCWFFVFAGYFFFLNVPEEGISWNWLKDKWKRRVFTLLIPFVTWNILAVFIPLIKAFLFTKLGIPQSDVEGEYALFNNGILYWFITGPADFPLWFMRDLLILCLLTPVIYVVFKHTPRYVGIIVLTILFLLPFEPDVFRWRGFFFFSLGAFLSIQRINMLSICRKVKWPAAIVAIILLLLSTFFNAVPAHKWLLRAFFPFGIITFMNIFDHLIDNEKVRTRLEKLSAAVFFIYASHAIYIMPWTNGLFKRLINDTLGGAWIRWFFFPIVVLLICLGLYYLLRSIMPLTLAFICGGRTKK